MGHICLGRRAEEDGGQGAGGECWGIDSSFACVGLEHPLSICVGLSSREPEFNGRSELDK